MVPTTNVISLLSALTIVTASNIISPDDYDNYKKTNTYPPNYPTTTAKRQNSWQENNQNNYYSPDKNGYYNNNNNYYPQQQAQSQEYQNGQKLPYEPYSKPAKRPSYSQNHYNNNGYYQNGDQVGFYYPLDDLQNGLFQPNQTIASAGAPLVNERVPDKVQTPAPIPQNVPNFMNMPLKPKPNQEVSQTEPTAQCKPCMLPQNYGQTSGQPSAGQPFAGQPSAGQPAAGSAPPLFPAGTSLSNNNPQNRPSYSDVVKDPQNMWTMTKKNKTMFYSTTTIPSQPKPKPQPPQAQFQQIQPQNEAVEVTEVLSNKSDVFERLDVNLTHTTEPFLNYSEASEAIFGIGIRLQLLLEREEFNKKNFLVSPFSTALIVGQLILGARGPFQKVLAELLVRTPKDIADLAKQDMKSIDDQDIPLLRIHQQLAKIVEVIQTQDGLDSSYSLKTAGALFLQPDVPLRPKFEQSLTNLYNTSIASVNFSSDPQGSQKFVNDWAFNSTHGKIKSILPYPLPRSSVAVLANAVYFKGDWNEPFSYQLSSPGPFYTSPGQSVNVTFLRGQIEEAAYFECAKLHARLLTLPYKNKDVLMHILLPNQNNGTEFDIKNFATNLHPVDILDCIRRAKERAVLVVLPKMSITSTFSILDPLKEYAALKYQLDNTSQLGNRVVQTTEDKFDTVIREVDVFQDIVRQRKNESKVTSRLGEKPSHRSVLSLEGASTDPRFVLSDIVQQVSLSIDEKGTEAAAISAGTVEYFGGVKLFRVDRPFMFFIRHQITGALLFWGTVINPTLTDW